MILNLVRTNGSSNSRKHDEINSILDKQIDWGTVDLKKLKVRDLKKILSDWDETCDGCLEKPDFIKRIEELKPKYASSSDKKELWILKQILAHSSIWALLKVPPTFCNSFEQKTNTFINNYVNKTEKELWIKQESVFPLDLEILRNSSHRGEECLLF